ncbi:hypothetical protein [Emcibacter nanhaiensis]|uniref:Uncharacterized protein n=1 Tax=Emcibacter nanhaiensis TaxID=1505037 RepID=A0A501PSH0_9PROT|nr:hypothetical protein [Emcibacter nanhaiensis]TPD63037.1 hypothetical protein FIV46_02865 [Emcibacter nanhaiensis]
MFIWLPKAKWFWTAVNVVAWVGGLTYIGCMLVWPWIEKGGDWGYVQSVWTHWQGLNVGVLAFMASVAALKNVQTRAETERDIEMERLETERKRKLANAFSFLLQELSILTKYFRFSMGYLNRVWSKMELSPEGYTTVPVGETPPTVPTSHRAVFSECMEYADEELYELLSGFLKKLQIHDARISDMNKSFELDQGMIVTRANVLGYIYRAAELQAIVNRLFNISRGRPSPINEHFTLEEIKTALSEGNIDLDDMDGLEELVKGALNKQEQTVGGKID